jgi:transcriptional regulator with XRE-family HTH domain
MKHHEWRLRGSRQAIISIDHTSISQKIGARIREIRQEQGLSQKHIGQMLGVSFQQLQKYESGTVNISIIRLLQLCVVFNITLDEIVYGDLPEQENILCG